jgi:hypothetical protein
MRLREREMVEIRVFHHKLLKIISYNFFVSLIKLIDEELES